MSQDSNFGDQIKYSFVNLETVLSSKQRDKE